MHFSSIIPDTQTWMIFFEARNETYSLIDILTRGYDVYIAHEVLEEITKKRTKNFSDLFYFIRKNMKLIKQVNRFSVALQKCQTFTESALVFLAKKLERESSRSFKEIMNHFDEGEVNAVAHCLYLSRTRPNGSIFVTQDETIVRPLREFFYMHQIGRVIRCDEFISSLELQIWKSSYARDLFSRYGILAENAPFILQSWIEKVQPYSSTPCNFTPWCQSYTFKPCWKRLCLSRT